MDDRRFDQLARDLVRETSGRRGLLKALAAGAVAAGLGRLGLREAAAGGGGVGDSCDTSAQCRGGLRCCDGFCRDIRSDERFCGSCRRSCRRGEACRNGGCFQTCRTNGRVCDEAACGTLCGCNPQTGGQGTICESLAESCGELEACSSDADCRLGRVCVNEGCCANKPRVCARPCDSETTARAMVAQGVQARGRGR